MTALSKFSTPAIRFLVASAIALGLAPIAAQAHDRMDCGQTPYHHEMSDRIPAHFKALDLTQDQQEKLQSIQATHQELMRKNMERLRANKASERALIEASSFDERKAEKLAAQDAKIMGENNLATLRFRHEIYQILTPEQRAKFEEMRKQHPPTRRP